VRRLVPYSITVLDACCALLFAIAVGDLILRDQPTKEEKVIRLDERVERIERWMARA
jgi:hypothetical protein